MDDEVLGLDLLEAMLCEMEEIKIVGKFTNPIEGLKGIEALQPDLLFLDIEMNEMNGINMAEKLTASSCQAEIVFVTAYEQYALEAFNVQAVDYILKPIDKLRLKKTVERISQRRNRSNPKPTQLYAGFLGSFRLLDLQNTTIKWRTKKVKELCAYLIQQNEPVHRDKIMEDLWPEHSLDKASTSLYTSVYQLRKELKSHGFPESIKYVDQRYSLTLQLNSDVMKIQQILSNTKITNEDVKKVLHLYKSDYLVEEDYYWCVKEREQLRHMVIQYLNRFIQINQTDDQSTNILKSAIEKLIEIDPWEESYTMEFIQYHIRQGNHREAIHIYNQYKKMLWQQLGEKPQEELENLIKRIN